MGKNLFCPPTSQAARESFIGTAPQVNLWILLECPGPWESKATGSLPLQVKSWLKHAKMINPYLSVQLIRQDTRPGETITCFIGVSQEVGPVLYKFQLQSYDELLTLNIPAIMAGGPLYETFLFQEPLFLVCTHEKHNRCCGTFGLPVYRELVNIVGEHAWQTSHIGGDKFAANMLCLPHGLCYGYVTVPEIEAIAQATRDEQVYLETYRGRTCYPPAVQVADAFLRKLLERRALDAIQLRSVENIAGDQWVISFESQEDHALHQLHVAKEKTARYSTYQGMETSFMGSYCLRYLSAAMV